MSSNQIHRLGRRDARRIAVRAQLLAAPRPTDVLEVVRRLGIVQVDLTPAVAPNVDLVCWSRLGRAYDPTEVDDLLASHRLLDLDGLLRPADDIALLGAEMRQWPGPEPLREWQIELREWMDANDLCRLDIIDRLREEGPLPAREIDDTCLVPWRSSGWSNNKNVVRMLEMMERRGEVAVVSRERRERVWDLAERVHPRHIEVVPYEDAERALRERRLSALGIARVKRPEVPGEQWGVGDVGERAVVAGVEGEWRVAPEQLGQPFRGRTALLSPLDRLVVDRGRLTELFEYEYYLEMYKPAAKRRWGYFALPVLHGDRLVGKLDAAADHRAGVLRINALHEDVPFTAAMTSAVDREITGLADLLGLEVVRA
ncbi:DNA glycosylase AlkZ-like family protein [Luteipulveratus flavus]|uniref:Crosslink repair DNA glycosylase YcaQ family protein n=1 Tax=Luteipulveratus flavus TaxID=3031728 RepID=A0ABT6CBF4_9MICO|nr:crosslink repair DNA glycosylase YcaQ family protein [Luteipulveratus sp. YIM 133296]MDF8266223.1 crosslink repair DNA glycosylase YcaQ family protein [Luteipulveratus sp. YIM 133296]